MHGEKKNNKQKKKNYTHTYNKQNQETVTNWGEVFPSHMTDKRLISPM